MFVSQNFPFHRKREKERDSESEREKKSYDFNFRSFESVKEREMIAYDTATEDHVFQMINELYRGDGASRDEVNQWLQG